MDELIDTGYLMRIKEIDENTSRVYFFLENGEKVSLKALGIQKVNSKNRINLLKHSICEIEYFQNPSFPNSGKLKRSNTIFSIESWTQKQIVWAEAVQELLWSANNLTPEIFKNVRYLLNSIKFNIFEISVIIFLINQILRQENIFFDITKCSICKEQRKISGFDPYQGGLICKFCDPNKTYSLPIDDLKILMELISLDSFKDSHKYKLSIESERKIILMFQNYLTEILGWYVNSLKNV